MLVGSPAFAAQTTTQVADDTCNVLPYKRLAQSKAVKERLLIVHGQGSNGTNARASSSDDAATSPVVSIEYKLVHE